MKSIIGEININTKDEALTALKQHVGLRNKMGGDLYWNIANNECCKIANKCAELGADRDEISTILGEGTHVRRDN